MVRIFQDNRFLDYYALSVAHHLGLCALNGIPYPARLALTIKKRQEILEISISPYLAAVTTARVLSATFSLINTCARCTLTV